MPNAISAPGSEATAVLGTENTSTVQPENGAIQGPGGASTSQCVEDASITNAIPPSEAFKVNTPSATPRGPSHRQLMNKLYALPAPIRTFPLPSFVPHNPLSLFHVLFTWLSHTINPSSSHFEPLYQGRWSPETRSVHITDTRSIRGLWEQGFYGKGNLSRSEPNWLEKEKSRLGSESKSTSEELTQRRRAERQRNKWERARKEREAIEQKLLEEAEATRTFGASPPSHDKEPIQEDDTTLSLSDDEEDMEDGNKPLRLPPPPVGPHQLSALPNSALDLYEYQNTTPDAQLPAWHPMPVETLEDEVAAVVKELLNPTITPLRSDNDEESLDDHTNGYSLMNHSFYMNGCEDGAINGYIKLAAPGSNGMSEMDEDAGKITIHSEDTATSSNFANGSALSNGSLPRPEVKRQKSVRFSPTVEQNTFVPSDPPSPKQAVTPTKSEPPSPAPVSILSTDLEKAPIAIKNQEHFQLTKEEAFFLSYTLGALTVHDPITNAPIPNDKLFELFRQNASFPPLSGPSVSPDDSFMLNYVVYHHYRSLGWVVRGGSKFSCDFMLYNRGPVFTHAEFAVLILPAYTDTYWSSDAALRKYVKNKEKRTWHWLHCINRVITQVRKTLVLVYVEIPAPFDAKKDLAIDNILGKYKVREFILQRWTANRQRGDGMSGKQNA